MKHVFLLPKAKEQPIATPNIYIVKASILLISIIVLSLIIPFFSNAQVTTVGASSASSLTTPVLGNSWSNPTNAASSNDSYASFSTSSTATTADLTAKNFGFSIPTNATILGVLVEIEKDASANSGSNYVTDNVLYLVNTPILTQVDISSNKADVTTKWNTVDEYTAYGGTFDVWSATLTPAIINSANFGLRFKATVTRSSNTRTAYVDHIRMTVYYDVDSDGDGILNYLDQDSDNDGIADFLEVKTCSGGSSLNWNSYTTGSNPATINVTNSPVTLTVGQTFTGGAGVIENVIENYFTGTSEKEIMINQEPNNYADKTTTTFNFSYPIYGITFKLQDVDYQNGTWIDSVKVTISYKGVNGTIQATKVTLGSYVKYKGNNVFIGQTGNSADGDLDGEAIINYPYMVDKIVIEYWNNDPSHGAQRIGYGGFTFCHLSTDDSDADGIPNYIDLDSDNDGIPDVIESYGVDANGDGRIDGFVDANNDGLSDKAAVTSATDGLGTPDFDGDGVANYIDLDSDNDGIPDVLEVQGADTNNDGKIDSYTDTDNDGYSDNVDGDVGNDGTAENSANSILKSGADTNSDGVANSWPNKNIDQLGKPNPYDLDSDGDGILDLVEAGLTGTNGKASGADANGDGWSDTIDALGSLTLTNTDANGLANVYDIDSDNDGITDNIEAQSTTGYKVPNDVDTDNDGINDVYEIGAQIGVYGGGGLTPFEKVSDGKPDYVDTDTDDDSIPDRNEGDRNSPFRTITQATIDGGTDTDGDGLMDVFDNNNITSLTAGNYYKNVAMSNMGPLGNFDGPTPSSSYIQLQQSDASGDRDWRNASILPLQIVNFTVNYQAPIANIKWDAVNELQTNYYEVQVSTNGVDFNNVININAKNVGTTNYSYPHSVNNQISNIFYYRIKQVDKDGKFYYTPIIMVKVVKSTQVTVSPNPFISFININYISDVKERIIMSIVAIDGRIITTKQVDVAKGANALQITNLDNFAACNYYLRVQSSTAIENIVLIKK